MNQSATAAGNKRFNVVQVIADQHHAGLMGCAGHPQAITPNLDAFAARGARFTSAYAQNPICTPSRVSVLSGQYCQNTGYYGLSGPTPQQLPSVMGHFKRHGYRTAGFGKLHLPHDGDGNWLWRDLDRLADTYENAQGQVGRSDYFTYLDALGLRHLEDSWHNPNHYGSASITHDAMPSELPYEHTQEVWCVREAMRFIDQSDDQQPFCVQIAFQKPHHPLLPQQKFWDWYPEDLELPATFDQDPSHRPPHFQQAWQQMRQRVWDFGAEDESFRDGARRAWRGTLACVSQIDDVFGMVLRGLEERGLSENTIVIYHSDHGCYHGMHGIEEKAPGICSDAVCRVPMIWRVPGVTNPGHVHDGLVENVDMAPTLASLCGLPEMDWVDGVDLSPMLRGEQAGGKDCAVTENPWSKALHWGRWRFVYYTPTLFDGQDVGELYDIVNDPDETRNLYYEPDHHTIVEQCRQRLMQWLIETKRHVTCQPALWRQVMPGATHVCSTYEIARDGKATNLDGPVTRQVNGAVRYL